MTRQTRARAAANRRARQQSTFNVEEPDRPAPVRKPPSAAQIRKARAWLKAMRAEAAAREQYVNEDEPRARERARKRWLSTRSDWAKVGMPGDEALKLVREAERGAQ